VGFSNLKFAGTI